MTIKEKIQRQKDIIEDFEDIKKRLNTCNIRTARMLIGKYGLSVSGIIRIRYEEDKYGCIDTSKRELLETFDMPLQT